MSKQVIFKETRRAGLALGPQKFQEAILRAMYTTKEVAVKQAKIYSQSQTLSGDSGGEGGISGRIIDSSQKIILIISATARNQQTGFNWALVRELGSGLYGSLKRLIFPKTKKILAWLIDGKPNPLTSAGWKQERLKGNVRVARSVKGQRGLFYLKKGIESARDKLDSILKQKIDEINTGVK